MQRTPPLTLEGSREVLEEMSRPPADTPERRATFEMARLAEEALRRMTEAAKPAKTG